MSYRHQSSSSYDSRRKSQLPRGRKPLGFIRCYKRAPGEIRLRLRRERWRMFTISLRCYSVMVRRWIEFRGDALELGELDELSDELELGLDDVGTQGRGSVGHGALA